MISSFHNGFDLTQLGKLHGQPKKVLYFPVIIAFRRKKTICARLQGNEQSLSTGFRLAPE
jgi:hypothetical protein